MLSDRYLSVMAHRLVPSMWVDDACQQARIAMWLAPDAPQKTVAKRAMIDFLRHTVTDRRSLDGRRDTEPITDIHRTPDPYAVVDMVLDFRAAWWRLARRERRVLRERVNATDDYVGHVWYGLGNGHQQRVSQARRRLRELVA